MCDYTYLHIFLLYLLFLLLVLSTFIVLYTRPWAMSIFSVLFRQRSPLPLAFLFLSSSKYFSSSFWGFQNTSSIFANFILKISLFLIFQLYSILLQNLVDVLYPRKLKLIYLLYLFSCKSPSISVTFQVLFSKYRYPVPLHF